MEVRKLDGGPLAAEHEALRRRVAELEASEDRFRSAFELCPQPMSIARASDGRYLEVNEAWCAATGFTRMEAVGRTSLELGLVRDVVARVRTLRELGAEGLVDGVPFEVHRKDGSVRRFSASARKLQAGEDAPVLAVLEELSTRCPPA